MQKGQCKIKEVEEPEEQVEPTHDEDDAAISGSTVTATPSTVGAACWPTPTSPSTAGTCTSMTTRDGSQR